jgi:hypothetical protein
VDGVAGVIKDSEVDVSAMGVNAADACVGWPRWRRAPQATEQPRQGQVARGGQYLFESVSRAQQIGRKSVSRAKSVNRSKTGNPLV